MIRRPTRSTQGVSSASSDVYKRQCTNCRWMESNIFTLQEVQKRLEQFVLVQLFTDGGENYREKQNYEIERFGTAALPYYVLLTPEDKVIAEFPGMTRNVDEFLSFLDKAL